MTAPLKLKVVPETIHHKPTVVPPPDTKDHYPLNKRWPPDPAIYEPVIAYDCRDLDRGMGR